MLEVAMAVAGSSVLTTLIVRFFDRKKDTASVSRTDAETQDILTQAQERALGMMANQLDFHQDQIRRLQAELLAAEARYEARLAALRAELTEALEHIKVLEQDLRSYRRTPDSLTD